MLLPEPAVFGYASIIADSFPFVKGFLKNIFVFFNIASLQREVAYKRILEYDGRRMRMNILGFVYAFKRRLPQSPSVTAPSRMEPFIICKNGEQKFKSVAD